MKKNFAVIGYGGQGKWHCSQLSGSDVATLKGVWDIDETKREQATEKGIYVYSSLDELLNDELDGVVVVTPNDVHKELVIKALNAGKNVICEKPVEMSVAAFDEMANAAKENNRLFTVYQNRRWDVDFLGIKSIVESGEIGELINIESRIHGSRGIPSDWRCHKQFGGGMMLDWGVHLIDQILQITGKDNPVVRIYCDVNNILTNEVDDNFTLRLTFKSGARATVEVGTYNFVPMPRFYLQCKNGSAIIPDWRENATVVKLKAWNEKDVLPEIYGNGVTKTMAARDDITTDTYKAPRPESDVHNYYRNVCAALDGKEEIIVKLCEVRRVLSVMETALECAKTGEIREVNI